MGLWGEEHSAQLSPEENKRRQFLFKDGARNLLSSTTTMELGIDIGGLNGVVLGNVPPGAPTICSGQAAPEDARTGHPLRLHSREIGHLIGQSSLDSMTS